MSGVLRIELLVVALLLLLSVLAIVLRIGKLESRVRDALRAQLDRERDRVPKEKGKRDELAVLRAELHADIEALRMPIREIAANLQRLAQQQQQQQQQRTPPPRAAQIDDAYEDVPRAAEDGLAQLVAIANRLVRQSAPTLDAFRAIAGSLSARALAWPNAADGQPAAFIVEHRGAYYAVPNIVRPTRLPKEWFNRSDFGVNDEIQRVVSLPRLTPRGNDFEVQQPGVFAS